MLTLHDSGGSSEKALRARHASGLDASSKSGVIRHRAPFNIENKDQAKIIELLHKLAKDNDVEMVSKLVADCMIHPDCKDRKGWTPIIRAAKSNALFVAAFLLKQMANANAKTREGNSAIHKAAKRGWTEMSKVLLGGGADVNLPNKGGATPLMLSVMRLTKPHKDVAQVLLDNKAGVNTQKDVGYSALMLTARVNNPAICKELLYRKANMELKDQQGETALAKAMKYRREEVRELLLQNGANVQNVKSHIVQNYQQQKQSQSNSRSGRAKASGDAEPPKATAID